MPYIITTKIAIDAEMTATDLVSRRAVATLDEARLHVQQNVPSLPGGIEGIGARIGSDGGTVGPLPDGTVIEVEPIDYRSLWETLQTTMVPEPDEEGLTEFDREQVGAEVLSEYNEARGETFDASDIEADPMAAQRRGL